MKKIFVVFLLLAGLMTEETIAAKKLRANFSYYTFNTPELKPYLETHLSVFGNSVKYIKKKSGKFQGSIQVTLICKDGDKIVNFDKYNLLSPEIEDTVGLAFSFIDQRRLGLPNGNYQMELNIIDNNDPERKANVVQNVKIDFPDNKISLSDIILIESYSKAKTATQYSRNGYQMIPMVDNFYHTKINKLIFYNEIYGTDKVAAGEAFILNYYIQNYEGLNKLNAYNITNKVNSKNVIITLSEFDISDLPNGNYNLIIELRNRNNEIIASKSTFLQRSNKAIVNDLSNLEAVKDHPGFPNYNLDLLIDYVKALHPISEGNDAEYVKTLLANGDSTQIRKYLIYFWQKRSPSDPAGEWAKYEKNVRAVMDNYSSTYTKGYATDRGYVYLKYGPPNNIRKNDFDNYTYPYEIWQYFRVKTFSNRKFLFCSMDNLKNEMVLIHSTVPGERNDPDWKHKVLTRTVKYADDDVNRESFGTRIEDDFNE